MRTPIILLLTVICSTGLFAQVKVAKPEDHGMDPERLARVDAVIDDAIRAGDIPGAVLSVVRRNDIVYLKAYGNKSVVPETVPMTVETMFDLASLSKCVGTTLSFMQLIERARKAAVVQSAVPTSNSSEGCWYWNFIYHTSLFS